MSQKKELRRAVKAVWSDVKSLRAERGKLYAPADLKVSADELTRHANDLHQLSQQLSALDPMPPGAAPAKTHRRKTQTTDN